MAETTTLKPGEWRRLSKEERIRRNQRAIEVLRSFREEGDAEEQRETGELLMRALGEDRTCYGKLFPEKR